MPWPPGPPPPTYTKETKICPQCASELELTVSSLPEENTSQTCPVCATGIGVAYSVAVISDVCTGGMASASTISSPTFAAYKAFDDIADGSSRWASADVSPPHWLKYDLGVGVTKIVQKLRAKEKHASTKDFILQGSNNDSDWDDIYTGQMAESLDWQEFTFPNSTAYRYYRFYISSVWSAYPSIDEMEMEEPWPPIGEAVPWYKKYAPHLAIAGAITAVITYFSLRK